uniref:Beta-defensin n=1 Tax=Sarcophilus harrisii TaxID=9305 RepID=A0A7N4PMN7_SARHA
MKVAFLTSVFLILVQKCWSGKGHCRILCKSDEIFFTRCLNHKKCCLPPEVETIPPMVIDETLLYPSSSPSTYEEQTTMQPQTSSSTSGP